MKHYTKNLSRSYSLMQGNSVHRASKAKNLAQSADAVIQQCDQIDEELSSTWRYWEFRMGRIFTPNFVLHVNSIVTLVLNVMQVLLIIEFVRKTDGNFSNTNTFVIMLPSYIHYSIRIVIQLAALVVVTENAVQKERKHAIFNIYDELHAVVPVIEHVIPVVTYIMFLLCAISIGGCHFNWSESAKAMTFCQNMNLSSVEGIIVSAIIMHVCHHLLAIYNHYRHTSQLKKKWTVEEESTIEMTHIQRSSIMSEVQSISDGLIQSMNWWKFRLSRIFSSNLVNNCCKILEIILEGVQIIILVKAFHHAEGHLKNVPNWEMVLMPTILSYFLKMTVVTLMLIYVCYRSLHGESKYRVIRLLSEPKGWIQIAEHVLPLIVYFHFGLTTVLISKCLVNPNEQGICEMFSWSALESIIMMVAIIMFMYHIRAIYNVHAHTCKWETKKEKYISDRQETASTVN